MIGDTQETAKRLVELMERRAASPKNIWGIPWGFPALDAMTGGIQVEPVRELAVLFSRPGVGKSALAGKVALNVANWLTEQPDWKGKVVRVVLLEMGRDAFQHRLACYLANVSNYRFQRGRLTQAEKDAYREAQRTIYRLPIQYLDHTAPLPEIEAFLQNGGNCAWWILDHIGLVPGAMEGVGSLSEIANQLLRICHQIAPGLVITHQKRKAYQQKPSENDDGRPTDQDVAGADQIVRNADLLLGLWRKDKSKRDAQHDEDPNKYGELIVMKQRNGVEGTIHLIYNTRRTEWVEHPTLNSFWTDRLGE